MRGRVCTKMVGFHLIEGAGRTGCSRRSSGEVNRLLLQFLKTHRFLVSVESTL